MERAEPEPGPLPDDWCIQHLDHLSEELAQTMPATMARTRALCPVTHSDAQAGLWVVPGHEEALILSKSCCA